MLPDFHSFIDTIDVASLTKEIVSKNPDAPTFFQFDPTDSVALNEVIQSISRDATMRAVDISFMILRHYHAWLCLELNEDQ